MKKYIKEILGIIIIVLSLYYLIVFDKFGSSISYVLYLIMTYSLIIICISIYNFLYETVDNIIESNKYLKEYKNNPKLRYMLSLSLSLFFNIIYVLFKLVSGIYFKSLWLVSFSLYYLILVILRLNILKCELNKDKTLKDEYKKYKNVGVITLFINLFLTIIILIIVNGKELKSYNEIVVIGVAVYTFYLMINSVITLIKYKKYKSPLITASKIINVVTSMVSMLSLEIIMLSTFSPDKTDFNEITIMVTGGGISLIIIGISLYMIKKANDNL